MTDVTLVGDAILSGSLADKLETKYKLTVKDQSKEGTTIKEIDSQIEATDLLVLSVGGNDLKAHTKYSVLGAQMYVDKAISTDSYTKMLQQFKSKYQKMIIVIPFMPFLGKGSLYGKIMSNMIFNIYKAYRLKISTIAKREKVAVLDLSKTMDPYDDTHYTSDPTTASDQAYKCIASSINYIYKHYQSGLYYSPRCGKQISVKEL